MEKNEILIGVVIVVLVALAAFSAGFKTCPACVLDCRNCPESTKEVQVYKYRYVCFNDSVVDFKEECMTVAKLPMYQPIVTNEDGTLIDSVEVRPTCIAGYKGGNIQYILKTLATNVTAEIKHGDGEWEDVFTTSGAFNDFIDFVICTKPRRCFKGDFELRPDTSYLLRLRFEARKNAGGTVYSNEHIVDTTEVSDYTQADCATATYYR